MTEPRFLDQTLFGALVEQAAASPRQRQHHNFHQMEEPCHRMAVGLQPDTYIPPHRHLSADKAEALLVLKGRLGVLIFDDAGEVLDKRVLQAGGECVGVDLPPGVFHALVVLEANSILFECKAGPYKPVGEGEQAGWAPREGEPGVADYRAWMRAQFT
ncbi:cupin fold metalloprotein, WbuC family [Pseudomonas sp. HMWF032]|uniref:WbuC family cupin fold metalloprotein n=1 Tax=unclassified Pseudomonas TaxID=196821 RepID=UPI000D38C43A|nr:MULTISPECIES: WbuC family cupin fold metalloprotein [unclassified Pseudomonas]PTS86688.1 cupin fold metalloprotein, WbuC family [Pseudomonas sp. HMWF032]PTT84480.1 cupin fold metalloprotein, WbuC family [Pseudomonas sp. HMWF010]WAC43391.1 WbuC family cupin fold metalloprotein [Pseudomonas sp. SL4(2022)]